MKRKQFPVRPAFAITSNKSTGSNAIPCRHLFETGFLFTWATLCCHESYWLKRQPQNLFRPWGIYQQCGLERSPATLNILCTAVVH